MCKENFINGHEPMDQVMSDSVFAVINQAHIHQHMIHCWLDTPALFRAYLLSKDADAIVGSARCTYSCPIAEFMIEQINRSRSYGPYADHYQLAIHGGDMVLHEKESDLITVETLPKWVMGFVAIIDDYFPDGLGTEPRNQITRNQALSALDNVNQKLNELPALAW